MRRVAGGFAEVTLGPGRLEVRLGDVPVAVVLGADLFGPTCAARPAEGGAVEFVDPAGRVLRAFPSGAWLVRPGARPPVLCLGLLDARPRACYTGT